MSRMKATPAPKNKPLCRLYNSRLHNSGLHNSRLHNCGLHNSGLYNSRLNLHNSSEYLPSSGSSKPDKMRSYKVHHRVSNKEPYKHQTHSPEYNLSYRHRLPSKHNDPSSEALQVPPILLWTSLPPPGPDHLHNMLEYIRTLENQLGIEPAVLTLNHRSAINIQEFHCLESPGSLGTSFYLAEPEWVVRDEDVMLRGRFPVHDPESYLQKRGNITFAVYKDYNTRHQQEKISEAMKANECLPVPEPASMSCSLISAEMTEAAKAFISLHPSFSTEFPEQASAVKNGGKISAPFIWWYHYRKSHGIRNLPPRQAELMTALTEWIERNYGHLYDKFDAQFRSGRVSAESLEYLIRPGHVLVKKEGKTLPLGFVATSRPELMETRVREPQEHDKKKYNWSFAVRVRSYQYNGGFFRSNDTVDLNFRADVKDGEVDIRSIDVVPLQYADLEVKELLARRGKTFWKCRNKRLVSYEGSPNSTDQKHAVCVHLQQIPSSQ